MPDSQHDNDKLAILDLRQQAIISNPVTPLTTVIRSQTFTMGSRVFTALQVLSDPAKDQCSGSLTTLDDCPDKVDGFPAKPVWMPERFVYVQGSMYDDFHVTSITHVFRSNEGRCIVDISQFASNEDATTYHYEQLPEENTTMYVARHQVAFYYNTDQSTLTASWLSENTNYFITGVISKEEIIQIIESMMK